MKIKKIKINSYGKLKEKEINLENNLNIIYGKNESGKSTLLNYIKNIFYGISKNKNGKEISDYEKYLPWESENFSGKIEYELNNGNKFEIFRDFNKKNPKVFNENLEDISSEFKIDKKDGNQFFTEQTGVDEKLYTSTILSTQKEVILDQQSQNVLVQKISNLMGTGDDSVSYKKAIDNLNKRQVEEIGNNRTQDRPINIVQDEMKKVFDDIKTINYDLNSEINLEDEKSKIELSLKDENKKNNIINELNKLIQKNEIIIEKNNLKNKIKIENEEKIKKLKEEKNKINKNNFINLENNLNNSKKYNSEKNKFNINIIYFITFILLIIINILNFIFIKNKTINYIILSLIPISIIIYLINNRKNKKIKKEIEKNNKNEKLINNEIEKQIMILDSQIKLLEEENKKQELDIKNEKEEIENLLYSEKQKIKEKYEGDNFNYLFNIDNLEQLQIELEKSNKLITNYQLSLNKIEYEQSNNIDKKEKLIELKEEYKNLEEQLEELNEKDRQILLTKELLEKAYNKMKNNVTPKFTQNLSSIIKEISNGKYQKLSINDENGLMVELENGEYIPATRLSCGTIDEIYLSLRLSMIEEISKEKMPILLDESFAYFDDERLKNVLIFLSKKTEEHQIILFTCTKREKEILEQLGISYNWVEI